MKQSNRLFVFFAIGILAFSLSVVYAQETSGKKVLTIQDYGRWRSIASVAVSDDGNWASWIYQLREGDGTLYVKQLDGDKVYTISIGSEPSGARGGGGFGGFGGGGGGGPQFSDDCSWVAYYVNPPYRAATAGGRGAEGRGGAPPAPGGQGGAQGAPAPAPTRRLELLNLASGDKMSWDSVASFAFAKGSRALIVKRAKLDREAAHNGTDMIVRLLDRGVDELFGSTGEYVINKPGTLLAFTADAAGMNGNGVAVLDLAAGIRRTLDSGKALYEKPAWDDEGTALALLKGEKKEGFVERENSLLAFKGMDKGEPEAHYGCQSLAVGIPLGAPHPVRVQKQNRRPAPRHAGHPGRLPEGAEAAHAGQFL